jgi:hypothetical protein
MGHGPGHWCTGVLLALSVACSSTAKVVNEPSARGTPAQARPRSRTLHPAPGSQDCMEMYGSCTEPPERLCTSSALVLACGESAELPSTGEQLLCACP